MSQSSSFGVFSRLGITIDVQLAHQLAQYLRTDAAPSTGEVAFSCGRSADVDVLLCRLALDGEDVAAPLQQALDRAAAGDQADRGDLPNSWVRQAARGIHDTPGLEDRVIAYAKAYWAEDSQLFGFGDREPTGRISARLQPAVPSPRQP